MTLEVRNKFIEKLLKTSRKDIDDAIQPGLGFRYGPDLISTHQACYSSFDGVGRFFENIPFWFYPCNSGLNSNVSITDRAEYAFHAITHPESPWQPFLDAMPEQFEGYNTPEDKAELIARVGLVFGPTAWETLNKVEVGCFAVFHRVAYEHGGVRESLKRFLADERTAKLPLRWNVFAASHLRSYRKEYTQKRGATGTTTSIRLAYPIRASTSRAAWTRSGPSRWVSARRYSRRLLQGGTSTGISSPGS